jgi:wyosine [tRNA(Phe)-imidazoG37] synthetase (radical SAM superfamily)
MSDREVRARQVVYGPVSSWRLGRSLGVDALSTPSKTCSFDCLYCQLGPTVHSRIRRGKFVPAAAVRAQLSAVREVAIDAVTFSGIGEPTLASNLGELVTAAREAMPGHRLAILTNGSLIWRRNVRRELLAFDTVVVKLDAPTEPIFRMVNRPCGRVTLAQVVDGIERFRGLFAGKLALQMMFVAANKDRADEMATLARRLCPDEVQLNTPLRPCAVAPLSEVEMSVIEAEFVGLPVLNVYRADRPRVTFVDETETLRRRPAERREGGCA